MKNLNDLISSHGVVLLNAQELKSVKGGYASFTCYCGFSGGSGENHQIPVSAPSLEDALNATGSVCHGQGATCNGA